MLTRTYDRQKITEEIYGTSYVSCLLLGVLKELRGQESLASCRADKKTEKQADRIYASNLFRADDGLGDPSLLKETTSTTTTTTMTMTTTSMNAAQCGLQQPLA